MHLYNSAMALALYFAFGFVGIGLMYLGAYRAWLYSRQRGLGRPAAGLLALVAYISLGVLFPVYGAWCLYTVAVHHFRASN